MISFKTQIDGNWKKLMELINKYFKDDIKENILKLHEHFEDRIKSAPASGRPNYHNCFKGGYLDHVIRVIETSLKINNNFKELGVKHKHSDSDIVLASMFHDLGKIGNMEEPYYIYQTDEWRRNKLNEWYTHNPKLEIGSVTDRSLWLLSKFNIDVSEEVYKAIKLSDGVFNPGNEREYRKSTDSRNILHYIVHFSDWMSTVTEKQHYLQSLDLEDEVNVDNNTDLSELKNAFDDLFNE
tara:strand:+ start:20 stop:736 length:717 start_codon:yes stop_codon:yes gene_type:complete